MQHRMMFSFLPGLLDTWKSYQ